MNEKFNKLVKRMPEHLEEIKNLFLKWIDENLMAKSESDKII